MKRNIIFAAFAALGALFLSSCNQELDDMSSATDESGMATITASFPEIVDSKVNFKEQTGGLDLTWEEEDYLTVVSGSVVEKYTIKSIDGKTATFTGNPVSGDNFDVILSRSGDYACRGYDGQTQTTVSSTDHLLYDAVLKGVNNYSNVSFTSEWAAENGGTFAENGCLMLNFKMPEDAGLLKSVTLTAPEAVFYTANSGDTKTASLALSLSDADMASDNVVKAYIMTSMQEASVAAETELTLTVVSNLGTWSKKFTPGAFTLKTGMRNVITLNDKNWTAPSGNGTEASPYIIRTSDDLLTMAEKLTDTKTYFAMVNDIDMVSVASWIKIENGTPIDFNGNNRKISNFKPTSYGSGYRGFIGILNGRLANLTISNANVDGAANSGTKPCGIACGYCGTKAIRGDIENVHVQGTVTANAGGVGGLVGVLGNGTINRCSADVNITNDSQRTGGIAGYQNDADASAVCEIKNCFAKGSIVSNHQKASGIISDLHGGAKTTNVASVRYCYTTVDVACVRNAAGVVANAWNSNEYSAVEYCIAWNPSVKTTGTTTAGSNYVSGAIVGSSRNKQALTDCVRRPDMDFKCEVTADSDKIAITPFDQENANSSAKLPYSGPEGTNYDYYYPYHGKAATAGETVSQVAKRLGWDETIWDLSGDYPQLIK